MLNHIPLQNYYLRYRSRDKSKKSNPLFAKMIIDIQWNAFGGTQTSKSRIPQTHCILPT